MSKNVGHYDKDGKWVVPPCPPGFRVLPDFTGAWVQRAPVEDDEEQATYYSSRTDREDNWNVTSYPDGNPKTAMGAKKPDPSVVPPAGRLHLATAMMNGAEKYGPFNWRDQPISSRPYIAAAMRHLEAYLDGEDFSQDTVAAGKPVHHLAHVMACCAILLDATEVGCLNDNRPAVKGKAGDMIERFNGAGSFAPQ